MFEFFLKLHCFYHIVMMMKQMTKGETLTYQESENRLIIIEKIK